MADVLFVEYPKCSTCKKAKAWLDAHGVGYVDRHIVEDNPTAEELEAWQAKMCIRDRTFTMAKTIEAVQKPTLVMAPNKTLAALSLIHI